MPKELTYARGRNPNSLANLQKGRNTYVNKEKASESGKKSQALQRSRRTMRELSESIGAEEQTLQVKRADGTIETVTMTRLEMIVRNFLKECVSNPNHKNVSTLQRLLGENESHIVVNNSDETKYNDIEVTDEMRQRALAVLQQKHLNGTN